MYYVIYFEENVKINNNTNIIKFKERLTIKTKCLKKNTLCLFKIEFTFIYNVQIKKKNFVIIINWQRFTFGNNVQCHVKLIVNAFKKKIKKNKQNSMSCS